MSVVKNGIRHVTMLRLSHPTRHQRLTVIPCPRYANKKFYEDWVYQPYITENEIHMSDDILAPLHVGPVRFIIGKVPPLAYFHPGNLPGPLDTGLTRREFNNKMKVFRSPFLKMALCTAKYRDRSCGSLVSRRVKEAVGEVYLLKTDEMQSFVFLLNPAWVSEARKTLEGLGFVVDEERDVEVGKEDDIRDLEKAGDIFTFVLLAYIWFLSFMCLASSAKYFADYGRQVRDEEVKTQQRE